MNAVYNNNIMSKKDLEKLLREIIKKGDEYDKVEFKSLYDFSQKKDKIRLIKCIAAIVNSDSTYFNNMGYIIIGAKRGELVGGFDALEKDSTSSNIHNWVRDYIEPKVSFTVERFEDSKVGWWGVIIIPPSSETHVFRKELSDQNLNIRRGDVFVRDGDSIILADKSDHDRLQRRKFLDTVKKYESRIESLEAKIEEQKTIQPNLKLYFSDKKNKLCEELDVRPIFDVKTEEKYLIELSENQEIKEIENELMNLMKEKEAGERGGISFSVGIKRMQLEDYEKDLKEYLKKLKEFKVADLKYSRKLSQVIPLNFALQNDGITLAEGITFYIYFPDDFKISKELDFFEKPIFREKRPKPPSHSPFADLLNSKPYFPDFISPSIPGVIDVGYGGPIIDKSNKSMNAKYWVNKLLHGHMHFFDPLYLLAPDYEKEVNLDDSIYAENVVGESEGTLLLKIKPKK